jgi:8-oxo-dGTP pyrophosphatase MutT (NUDIX family)
VATLRHTRYQAAILRDDCVLLVRCVFRDGRIAWFLPGGGREEDEDETMCVEREVLEECSLVVRVDALLSDVPADPPDGTYVRWRTYRCTVLDGEAKAGGGEGPNIELTGVQWLPLSEREWSSDITGDPVLHPQLLALRSLLNSR